MCLYCIVSEGVAPERNVSASWRKSLAIEKESETPWQETNTEVKRKGDPVFHKANWVESLSGGDEPVSLVQREKAHPTESALHFTALSANREVN